MSDQIKLDHVEHRDGEGVRVYVSAPNMMSGGTFNGKDASGIIVQGQSASDLRAVAMVLLEAAALEDGEVSTRFEYRVRGERSEGVNAGMEWGNHESDWKSHLPRRYDVEILARRRNRDVMVERRTVIVGEPTVVAFEDLAP